MDENREEPFSAWDKNSSQLYCVFTETDYQHRAGYSGGNAL